MLNTLKTSGAIFAACLALAACAPDQPHIIQASSNNQEVHLKSGMATQIEMPDNAKVQTLTTGNNNLIDAQQSGDVVTLMPKGPAGETNLIIRARGDNGPQVYQYHITVDAQ